MTYTRINQLQVCQRMWLGQCFALPIDWDAEPFRKGSNSFGDACLSQLAVDQGDASTTNKLGGFDGYWFLLDQIP